MKRPGAVAVSIAAAIAATVLLLRPRHHPDVETTDVSRPLDRPQLRPEVDRPQIQPASKRRQWPAFSALLAGLLLAGVSLFLRVADTDDSGLSGSDLNDQQIGVFADVDALVGLGVVLNSSASAVGTKQPDQRFRIELYPAGTTAGVISYIQLADPEIWTIDVTRPIHLIVMLPNGATLTDDHRSLIVGTGLPSACASWFSAGKSHVARSVLHHDVDGTPFVTCDIPAFGSAESLAVEIPFEWKNALWRRVGFGRVASSVRLADHYPFGDETYASQPPLIPEHVALQLDLPPGDNLADSFPSPTSGGHSDRVWDSDAGEDIDYTMERPVSRVWVQPAIDLSLLLAGVMLGLIPALWRRKE